MCTVTYIPKNTNDYILTSSRDENINRSKSHSPEIVTINNVDVLFPKDGSKGGTWVGVTNNKRTLCLLNGAFEKHIPTGNYTKSRGLVVLDFFENISTETLLNTYNLEGIEPFTLIIIDNIELRELTQLKWDGITKHIAKLNAEKSHIWSSATLYNTIDAIKKENTFLRQLNVNVFADSIINYHEFGTKQKPDLMKYINSNSPIETVSITQIESFEQKAILTYKSLLELTTISKTIAYNLEIA